MAIFSAIVWQNSRLISEIIWRSLRFFFSLNSGINFAIFSRARLTIDMFLSPIDGLDSIFSQKWVRSEVSGILSIMYGKIARFVSEAPKIANFVSHARKNRNFVDRFRKNHEFCRLASLKAPIWSIRREKLLITLIGC